MFVAGGAWLATKALTAKDALEEAQGLVGTVKDQAGSLDFNGIGQTAERLSVLTDTAVQQTADPVWRAAEYIPVAGANLKAVRQLAESVDSLATDTIAPLAAVASGLSVEALKPVDGKVNLEPIVQLSNAIGPASAAFRQARADVASIEFDGTVSQVSAAGDKLNGMLTTAEPLIDQVEAVLTVAPGMLGADGPRRYVLIFENLAETTALGGTAAALSEVTLDNGAISITRQASSQDFPWRVDNPVIPIDPAVSAVFNGNMYLMLNLATSRPDFPTAAQITSAFWEQDIGGVPDGVISIDPVALSHILGATGPVSLSTGDQLSADNAVALLLNEIYFRYQGEDGPDQTDAFFEEAAKTLFGALTSSSADPKALVESLMKGVKEHRIMAWSAHPEEQAVLATSPVAGVLPTTNEENSTTGVFFRDMSVSKMDFYLKTAATLTTDVCTAATPTFTTTVDLHSDLTEELADELPAYVASGVWKGEKFKTQVFIYGPPGTTLLENSVIGGGDDETFVDAPQSDLGRPVSTFWVMLKPGETKSVTATFTGAAGEYGSPALWPTPMLNPTTTTVNAAGCQAK
ncbi:uncharacterized protein DUF4012 [Microterricola gilva]|uniref:Uncharacterized protein DUF4012 n=1 Tax=Microterricola gilva TaxID=393267 RepID=A0A4Q8AIR9_9MICO|nr:uncharacterized protein DUF4012 [Microterricola gilva]